jgi:hypothetical protein
LKKEKLQEREAPKASAVLCALTLRLGVFARIAFELWL